MSKVDAEEVWKDRIELPKPFQVNSHTMEKTGNPNVKFVHCLPAIQNCETAIGEDIDQK